MSASWFLMEVASPEESGFSLETRCQGKCSRDLLRTSAGCLEPSGQCPQRMVLCRTSVSILKNMDMAWSSLLPSPSLPPNLEEPRGSISLLDITTCMALGLSVKCKQFPGWQGGWWNYILGFQFSGTSESPRPWLTFGMGFVLYLWEFH